MSGLSDPDSRSMTTSRPGQAWAYAVIVLVVIVAFGEVWARGIQGDDLCMCELASTRDYWDAVRYWLEQWNGRVFLALTQIGSYHLPWFASPLQAPWFILHGMVVLAHLANCGLLFGLLSRAGVSTGAALAAVLVLAVHPVTFESVLWLAAAYGYVFGTLLTLLAVWSYLEYERRGRIVWLAAAFLLALAASMGIEQYLVVLAALALLHWLKSRGQKSNRPSWMPLLLVACCAAVFLAIHFGLFASTGGRIVRATAPTAQVATPGFFWTLAWFMSLVPESSPYGGLLQIGLEVLKRHGLLLAIVALAALCAGWRTAVVSAWNDGIEEPSRQRHLWLIATGMVIFIAAMSPFLFTGIYGFGKRNLYPALPGLLIAGSAGLDWISKSRLWHRPLRYIVAPAVTLGVAISLVIDIGAQDILGRSWAFHRDLIEAIQTDSDAIRKVGALEVTGIPAHPYRSIAQIDSAWAFPCLVRWVIGDTEVKAWNNLMPTNPRFDPSLGRHRIHWREH